MIGQFIVNGFITGILYSLLAIGFALVYNTTSLFHIVAAASDVFAAFKFYWFSVTFGLPIFFGAIIALVLPMGLSLLTNDSVYRPQKKSKSSNNMAIIASIGMMTVIVNLLALFFGNETKVIDNTIYRSFTFGNIIITTPQMWQLVVVGIVFVAIIVFVWASQWGIRFRALSVDGVLFGTMGYNKTHTRTLVFLMSGAFIAIGSCRNVYAIGLDSNMLNEALNNNDQDATLSQIYDYIKNHSFNSITGTISFSKETR